jgi:Ser/Thr protein kinase RdoA (MazF antagonist)
VTTEQLASLALSHALHQRVPSILLPHPLQTRTGALSADLDGVPIALFDFIEGETHPPRTPALDRAVAHALATLHRSAPLFEDFPLRREAFELPSEPDLRRYLEVAARIEPSARPGLVALRAWVDEHGPDMLAQLERLHALQPQVREIDAPLLLCHTDLHGNNVLRTPSGEVYVLDWDDAKLAPPEHDLWIALGEHAVGGEVATVRAFFEAYRAAGGDAPLHLQHFDFYLLRRFLEDATISIGRLLAADADPRDDEDLLRALDDWGATRWLHLDDTLEVVAAALA